MLALCLGCTKDAALDAGTAATSVTRTIGKAGGSLSLPGATVTIPPEALPEDRTVAITETSEAIPADYDAYSQIYRFEPSGLVFMRPVSIELGFAGDASRASVLWSSPSSGRYEPLVSTVSGAKVSALVEHFSYGFAGSVRATDGGRADAALPRDAGETDAAEDARGGDAARPDAEADASIPDARPGPDSGASDAGAAACVGPPAVDPIVVNGDPREPGWYGAPRGGTVACPRGGTPALYPFTVTTERQVTLYYYHALQWTPIERTALIEGCTGTGRLLAETGAVCSIGSARLHPGTYSYAYCGCPHCEMVIDPPPAAATNVSCATAASIGFAPGASYHEDLVIDGNDRYYQFTVLGPSAMLNVHFSWENYAGEAMVSVRTNCGDPGSAVATSRVRMCIASRSDDVVLRNVQPGTYWIVASQIQRGSRWNIAIIAH